MRALILIEDNPDGSVDVTCALDGGRDYFWEGAQSEGERLFLWARYYIETWFKRTANVVTVKKDRKEATTE